MCFENKQEIFVSPLETAVKYLFVKKAFLNSEKTPLIFANRFGKSWGLVKTSYPQGISGKDRV